MKNPWAFGRDVVAQALGTLLGGAMALLIAKLSGVLGGVDWGEVGKVAVLLLIPIAGSVVYLVFASRQQRAEEQEREETVRTMLDNMSEEEAVAINAYTDDGRWSRLSEDERKKFEGVLARMLKRYL